MVILGINAYHGDSSACLVIDGDLICAIEEERIRRIKHWAGLPVESIKWCLSYASLDIKDVDYIAISRDPSAHLHKKLLRVLLRTPKFSIMKSRLQNAAKISDVKDEIAQAVGIAFKDFKAKVQNVEHHRAHLGSSFFVSPFEEALCVSVDGFGDFLSCMRGVGRGNNIDVIDWVEYPHSLGVFYTALTQFLGFSRYGDEYKVMGLSAFGKPVYMEEMRKIVKLKNNGLFDIDTSYFLHDKEGTNMLWSNEEPFVGKLWSDKFNEIFGKPREEKSEVTEHHCNIASSLQCMYEEAFFHILNDFHNKTGSSKITLSGGCVQNSLANGKILDRTAFKEVYIQPASYDAGTAIGAAFWVWNVVLGQRRGFIMDSPFWGPAFTNGYIGAVLHKRGIKNFAKLNGDEVIRMTARDIAEGKVLGWFQGRSEWGPRALGNRSILADPRKKEMQDILNARIKSREWFRPFAPSIMEEHTSEWFEHTYPVPFMEKVYSLKPAKRDIVPAVTHIDGTGRLQTVSRKMNEKYHRLISEFFQLTGVPLLLNTSFNENEPIVNTPEEALNCFIRTKMDVLVIDNYYITK